MKSLRCVLQGVTQLILATDMARHSEIIESFKSKLDGKFDFKNKDHIDTVKPDTGMPNYNKSLIRKY